MSLKMINSKTDELLVAIDELNTDMDAPEVSSGGLDLDNIWNEEQPEQLIAPDSVDSELAKVGEHALRGNLLTDPT